MTDLAVSTPATQQLGGVTGKGFLPGKSGNPGGRLNELTVLARKQTRGGKLLVAALKLIALGTDAEIRAHFRTKRTPSMQDRLAALEQLADRAYGRPRQAVDATVDASGLMTDGARENLGRLLAGLADRAEAPKASALPTQVIDAMRLTASVSGQIDTIVTSAAPEGADA